MLLAAADPSGDPALVCAGGRAAGDRRPGGRAGRGGGPGRVRRPGPVPASAGARRPPISPPRCASDGRRTRPWRRRPTRSPTPIAGRGIGPRRWPPPTRRSRSSWSRSAGRAQARGGLAAAAAFLERSVALTADPARQADRALAAAQVSLQAGGFGNALDLLAAAEAGPLDEFARARVDLLRGQVVFASGHTRDAATALLEAARRLEPFDLDLARETYLAAWGAAILTVGGPRGDGRDGDVLREICRSVLTLPTPPDGPRPLDLTLEGLALLITDGHAAAASILAASSEDAHQHPGRGGPALGLGGHQDQQRGLGLRGFSRDFRPPGPARPRRRRARRAAVVPVPGGGCPRVDGRLRRRRRGGGGEREPGRADREPVPAPRRAAAAGDARP